MGISGWLPGRSGSHSRGGNSYGTYQQLVDSAPPEAQAPTRWKQYSAALSACMSILAAGAWFGWPTPLLIRLQAPDSPVPMTRDQISWMVTFIEVGNLIGPIFTPFVADRFGRKPCILLGVPLMCLSFYLTVFMKTVEALDVARVVTGIAMGSSYAILPVYLGEISSAEVRGTVTSLFHISWSLGCFIPFIIGPFLSYDVFTCVILMTTLCFGVCFVCQPESPYYHALKGDTQKTVEVLMRLRDQPTDDIIQRELKEIQLEVNDTLENKASWTDIVATSADRRAVFLIIVLALVSYLSGQNAILTYSTQTFTDFPTIVRPEFITCAIGFFALLGSIFSSFALDTFGRRFLLLWSAVGSTVTLSAASISFYSFTSNPGNDYKVSPIAPLAVIACNFFFAAGMHPVCVIYASELFPTHTRGFASSICSLTVNISCLIVVKVYPTSSSWIYFVYACYAFVSFLGLIFFYFMMPETKGKTFAEIRESLMNP